MSKKTLKIAKKARKYAKQAYYRSKVLIMVGAIFCSMGLPHNSMAVTLNSHTPEGLSNQLDEPSPNQMVQIQEYSILDINNGNLEVFVSGSDKLPVAQEIKPRILMVSASAYTSEVSQTDASPCITANGFNVCKNNEENVIATNILPFGTKVRIRSVGGDKIYTVQDRMNARYNNSPYIDLWFKDKNDAIKFGRRTVEMEILDMSGQITLAR